MANSIVTVDAEVAAALPGFIGIECGKCGCDNWVKETPSKQATCKVGRVKLRCKTCNTNSRREYNQTSENKAAARAASNKYYATENGKATALATKKVFGATPHGRAYIKANTRAYRLAKMLRVPTWADLKAIKEIYEACPEGYHVDHIVPLQGELVSGLHVENNLQYLTATENMSKGNKWDVY